MSLSLLHTVIQKACHYGAVTHTGAKLSTALPAAYSKNHTKKKLKQLVN